MIGRTLDGKYLVLERLGEGGMGAGDLERAVDDGSGDPFALQA